MTDFLARDVAVDLTNCDREPIHILGAVQPDGVLVAVVEQDWTVAVISASAAELLAIDPAGALGQPVEEVLGEEVTARLRAFAPDAEAVGSSTRLPYGPGVGPLSDGPADLVIHRTDGLLVAEFEPAGSEPELSPVSYRSARSSMRRLADTKGVLDFADVLAEEIHALTGFDRVMIYRFDPEWNGEVIAEVHAPWLHPLKGQHYPASDIPVQARRLYTLNWLRLIADVHATRSPLLPEVLPELGRPLDLSFATLRSVSPIHIEYLRNMGVTASMSVSLLTDGQLWGMITCHHYSGPRRPSYEARSAAEFLGQAGSLLVKDRETNDAAGFREIAHRTLRTLSEALAAEPRDPLTVLAGREQELLALTAASGAVLHDGRVTRAIGDAPDDPLVLDALARTARTLREIGWPADGVFSTDRLSGLDPDAAEALRPSGAAGVLLAEIDADRWIAWLRPEVSRVIEWGGDPHDKQLSTDVTGEVRLSPRLSFEKWQEVVRGTATPWAAWDLDAARDLSATVSATLLRLAREQLTIVQDLHDRLQPETAPTGTGLQLGAAYRPAAAGQLGGDWWDVVAVEGTRTALVLGDVAGHGVSAAATMMQIRTALRAYLLDSADPGRTLGRLDRLIARLYPEELVTVVLAILDGTTGTLDVARAGHPPPLLLAEGSASYLEVPAHPPLGLGMAEGPAVARTTVPAGGTLVLYSDGLIERRGHSLAEGQGQLLEAARRSRGVDPTVWAEGLLDAVPGPAPDDTSLLVARRR